MKVTVYTTLTLIVILVIAQLVLARVPVPVVTTPVTWTYTVQHNDTLWHLARRYYPRQDPREITHDIRALNGLASATIRPGQRLKMPAGSNRVEVEE